MAMIDKFTRLLNDRSLDSLIAERDELEILITRRALRPTKAVLTRLGRLNDRIERAVLAKRMILAELDAKHGE